MIANQTEYQTIRALPWEADQVPEVQYHAVFDCNSWLINSPGIAGQFPSQLDLPGFPDFSEELIASEAFVWVPSQTSDWEITNQSSPTRSANSDDACSTGSNGDEAAIPPSSSTAAPGGYAKSSSNGSSRKRSFAYIEPKPDMAVGPGTVQNPTAGLSERPKAKRSKLTKDKKEETNATRRMNACIACRMQRNRVSPPFPRY